LASLRELYAGDSPAYRIYNAVGNLGLQESRTPRSMAGELYSRETLRWTEFGGFGAAVAQTRIALARAEIRNGAMKDAEEQTRIGDFEGSGAALGKAEGANLSQALCILAEALLERGDAQGAAHYLDRAAAQMSNSSDTSMAKEFAVTRGQLEISLGRPDQATGILESAIRSSEGADVRHGDPATEAEFAETDHDAYAELAASWLAQGRPAESVLALWERFRLRSRGLPIAQCAGGALDCEIARLATEERKLGASVVVGQIALLDRVLVYRMDSRGVTWSERRAQRQQLLDAAQALQRAVSSPHTTLETAAKLGAGLAGELMPSLPASLPAGGALLLEPDPLLGNLPWPVLPEPSGPLGLAYPVSELRSVLAPARDVRPDAAVRALVVGASVAGEGEPPLPEAMAEARDVDRFLHAPDVLLGDRATAARVGEGLETATVFHFAGHAVQTANGAELLLAASSSGDKTPWVDGAFVRRHPPRACRLAVLSACATGNRAATWNHPFESLVESFGALGVPEVVATRWQIDSEASVPMMEAFYRSLAKGETAAVALAEARRAQFASPSYKNPYYWGAYYVTGRETTYPLGKL